MPVVLDLGALGHGEAHPDEHVLELLDRLGDEVEVPGVAAGPHLGEVEPLGREARPAGGRGELRPALGQRRLARSAAPRCSARPTCLRSSGSSRAELPLDAGDPALLPEELGLDDPQLVEVGRGRGTPPGVLGEPGDLVDHGLRTVTDRPTGGKFIGRRRWGRHRAAG